MRIFNSMVSDQITISRHTKKNNISPKKNNHKKPFTKKKTNHIKIDFIDTNQNKIC